MHKDLLREHREVFYSVSHWQGDALQGCRRTHPISLSPKAQVSKTGLFKDCIRTALPFSLMEGTILGKKSFIIPPISGADRGTRSSGSCPRPRRMVQAEPEDKPSRRGPQDGAAGGLSSPALPWKALRESWLEGASEPKELRSNDARSV